MRNRKYKIYDKGDIVIYNGDTSHAFDASTLRLMRSNLRAGLEYKIKWVSTYSSNKYSVCYELVHIVGERADYMDFAWYPYQSFYIDYSLKYNLK